MDIKRSGSRTSAKAPPENFTGVVRIDPYFPAIEPFATSAAAVTFEPCARTVWHTHPLVARLIVTSGCGRVQRWAGSIETIRAGDVILTNPAKNTGTAQHRRPR